MRITSVTGLTLKRFNKVQSSKSTVNGMSIPGERGQGGTPFGGVLVGKSIKIQYPKNT